MVKVYIDAYKNTSKVYIFYHHRGHAFEFMYTGPIPLANLAECRDSIQAHGSLLVQRQTLNQRSAPRFESLLVPF